MAFLNDVKFLATTSGTADFGIGIALPGFQVPSTAGAVDGETYSYTARLGFQFESGHGVYSSSSGTIARTTVLDSSAGVGVKANFNAAPTVILSPIADDFAIFAPTSIAVSGDFTVAETHRNKRVLASKATTLVATLPKTLLQGFQCVITHEGTSDQINFVAESGATINSLGGYTATAGRYSSVYVWVQANSDGNSAIWQLDGPLTLLDIPILSNPSGSNGGSFTALLSVETDKNSGTLYWVITQSPTTPTAAQIIAGQNESGAAAVVAGNQAVSIVGTQTHTASTPTNAVTYYAHFLHQDAQTNLSIPVSSASFQTFSLAAATTWNPADKDSNLTLSNGNLTATVSIVANALVRSVQPAPASSKKFFSIKVDSLTLSSRIGIANSSAQLFVPLGNDTNGIGYDVLGFYQYNNIPVGGLPTYTVNDIIDVAFDEALNKIWFRKNNGNWNNDILANQNPTTGVGGFDTSGITGSHYPIVHCEQAVLTATFKETDFVYPAPFGFTQIDA